MSLSYKYSMRKKIKPIIENVNCLEQSEVGVNVIKNVKCLGIYSKNGRVYPLDVMKKALSMYDGVMVNLNHRPNEPRDVQERFGQIINPRLEEDGIYGDLKFNTSHPWGKAFEYFAREQPGCIGLSHAAIAKTKMDHKTGVETVEEITELESVDIVANAATNKNLFESYTQILESVMKKGKDGMEKKKDEVTQVLPGKKVYIPEGLMDKEYDNYEEYCKDMKEALTGIMNADLTPEEKADHIMGLMAPKEDDEEPAEEDMKKDILVQDEDVEEADDEPQDKKKKAEESIRKSGRLGMKMLLEELDAYRTRDSQAKIVAKINDFCKSAGLDKRFISEAFVDVLVNTDESKWKALVEDRKQISANIKQPISFGSDSLASKGLTVDDLMKQLRS